MSDPARRPRCGMCGKAGDGSASGLIPLGWTVESTARDRPVVICPECTRDNVRAIEAKLDREWW